MPSRKRPELAHLPNALVLAALGGVAFVGWLYDWRLPLAGGAPPAAETAGPAGAGDASGDGPRMVRLASAEAAAKCGLRTAPADARPVARYVHAHGVLDFDQTRYARLAPRAAGVVWSADVQAGDRVRAGDVLAVVESSEVGKAKSEFLQSVIRVQAREQNARAAQETPSTPEWSRRELNSQLREARAKLFADQQALLNLGLSLPLDDYKDLTEDQLVRRLRLLGLPKAVVSRLDPETATANLLPVTAPFAGVVVSRDAVVGQSASPSQPLFAVADLSRLWLRCEMRLEDVRELKVGQPVYFKPDGAVDYAPPGRLSWISATAEEKSFTVPARAEVENPDGNLRAKTPFEGRVQVRLNPNATAVPDAAVQADGKSRVVFVRHSDVLYEARAVEVGDRDGGFTEIVSGLQPGEVVVTDGSHVLKAEWLKDRLGGDD
jgi:cobalt-zinc-cadmium efflux system membrane fusion protein